MFTIIKATYIHLRAALDCYVNIRVIGNSNPIAIPSGHLMCSQDTTSYLLNYLITYLIAYLIT